MDNAFLARLGEILTEVGEMSNKHNVAIFICKSSPKTNRPEAHLIDRGVDQYSATKTLCDTGSYKILYSELEV